MQKSKNIVLVFFLLLFSSVLFSLSFPGFVFKSGCSVFGWFCFVPLFFALQRLSLKKAFFWGFFYGLISYSLLVYWLYKYSPLVFIMAVVFYAFLYGLLFILLKLPLFAFEKAGWILQCLILISFEFIKTKGFLGFSYGITGYSQYKCLPLIKIADLTGVYGISALVIFCSGICYSGLRYICLEHEIKRRKKYESHNSSYNPLKFEIEMADLKEKAGFKVFLISSSVFLLLLFSVFLYGFMSRIDVSSLEKVRVCAVQHNENSREDGVNVYAENISDLTQLTDEAFSLYPEIDIVVWPETAVTPSIMYQYYYGKDTRRISIVKSLLQYIENRDSTFVIGNYHAEREGFDGKRDFNSALVFESGKNVIPPEPGKYFKQHLVPLSEEFPFENHFLKFKEMMIKIGGDFWCKGKESKVFESKGLKFSTPICFEDSFPDICREMTNLGSRCFMNLTNDSWGESLACQKQHLSMAVFRSVENRVPTVRSSTSGQTCVIYPDGKVIKEAAPFCKAFVVADVPVMEGMKETFYTRYGDLFAFAVLGITGLLLIIGCVKGIIKSWQNRY